MLWFHTHPCLQSFLCVDYVTNSSPLSLLLRYLLSPPVCVSVCTCICVYVCVPPVHPHLRMPTNTHTCLCRPLFCLSLPRILLSASATHRTSIHHDRRYRTEPTSHSGGRTSHYDSILTRALITTALYPFLLPPIPSISPHVLCMCDLHWHLHKLTPPRSSSIRTPKLVCPCFLCRAHTTHTDPHSHTHTHPVPPILALAHSLFIRHTLSRETQKHTHVSTHYTL